MKALKWAKHLFIPFKTVLFFSVFGNLKFIPANATPCKFLFERQNPLF